MALLQALLEFDQMPKCYYSVTAVLRHLLEATGAKNEISSLSGINVSFARTYKVGNYARVIYILVTCNVSR